MQTADGLGIPRVANGGPSHERAPRHGDARSPSRDRLVVVAGLFLLVLIGVVRWRKDSIFTGGMDPIVLIKAALGLITLGGAMLLWMRTRVRIPIGLGPAFVSSLVLLVSLLGSVVAGNASATSVLIIRVGMLMATVLLLLSSVPWTHVLACLMAAMAALAVIAGVTGLGTLGEGRLAGGVPEIHPNELAGLTSVPLIGIVVFILRTGVRVWSVVITAVLLGLLVATGSRTALLGVAVALVVALLTNGRLGRGVVVLLLVALPLSYSIVAFTDVLESLASRGGSSETTGALDSRFDAWKPVLAWPWESWEKWIGQGLSVKEVKVDVKWLEVQVLDSSWVSLLAQTGIIGLAMVAGLLAWCVISVVLSSRRRGALLPLLVLLIIGTWTESGLLDSATPFIMFLTVATLATRRSRHAPRASGPGFAESGHTPSLA